MRACSRIPRRFERVQTHVRRKIRESEREHFPNFLVYLEIRSNFPFTWLLCHTRAALFCCHLGNDTQSGFFKLNEADRWGGWVEHDRGQLWLRRWQMTGISLPLRLVGWVSRSDYLHSFSRRALTTVLALINRNIQLHIYFFEKFNTSTQWHDFCINCRPPLNF